MSTRIFDLIESEQWDTIRQIIFISTKNAHDYHYSRNISLAEELIHSFDNDGMTPLHLAASKLSVPQDIIVELIEFDETTIMTGSKSLSIPLHYACESGSADTVKTLLDVAYKSPMSTPIQYYTKCLDVNERTPLERAWLAYLTPSVIDHHEIYCLEEFSSELLELWRKTELILFASHQHSLDLSTNYKVRSKWHILHQIARSGRECWCPNIVMWYALKLGFQYQVHLRDEEGNLPLHIAAKNPVHKILFIPRKSQYSTFMNKSVIEILIHSYPGASRIKNMHNLLPLQLAIMSGKKEKDGIGALLKANPNSVNALDPTTKLYPFLLSACRKHTANDNGESIHFPKAYSPNYASLDLTYKLLRSSPDLILEDPHCMRKRTYDEERKFHSADDKLFNCKKKKL